MKKNLKIFSIIMIMIIVLSSSLASIFVLYPHIKEKQYNDLLRCGQTYLINKNYTQAEDSYLKAIDIEPKKPEAYVELADVYVVQDRIEDAKEILSKGKENVDEENIQMITEKETEIDNFSNNNEEITSLIPSDAIEYNGHSYYVYSDVCQTWEEAEKYCENLGGHLAVIDDEEENKQVYDIMHNLGYSDAYFGYTDAESEGNWKWVNGSYSIYTNWSNGEPNNEGGIENYAMFYHNSPAYEWNDGDFSFDTFKTFICEWETSIQQSTFQNVSNYQTSDERDIVLVLDTSGSMSGNPLEETKKASQNFINTILKEDASIGIVTYDSHAQKQSDFSVNRNYLSNITSQMYADGSTNIEDGLKEAQTMLNNSHAKKKIIVLMSDGEPNEGKQGDELIAYADKIKSEGIYIYTLGFFEYLYGEKTNAQQLMEQIASEGCHYEVDDAENLVFFFNDIADQINGQKYIYVRIACPVDVSVTYNGQTLNSSEDDLNIRTDFGTLTFEESDEEVTEDDEFIDTRIKVLRLKEGVDYDIKIVGTGRGTMNYTIGFMDDNGDYSDLRNFEDIKITRNTIIDTVATVSDESILKVDEDGDGRYDVKYRATKNGYGEEMKTQPWIIYGVIILGVFLLMTILVFVIKRRKKATNKS